MTAAPGEARRRGVDPLRGQPDALAVAFTWHQLGWEELRDLVQRSETLGYSAAYVDGDVSQIPSLGERDVLDGWTVTAALTQCTARIALASIRLVHHWNAARLAQAIATQERIAPGRQRALISIGAQRFDQRFGLPWPPVSDRIAWLDETLAALRALWAGEEVSARGRFVALDRARVRPALPAPPPLEIAAAGSRMLALVAQHADAWNINVPPLPARVAAADARFEAACAARGRDPRAVTRTLQIFARPGLESRDPALIAAFRRFHPWFADVSEEEIGQAALVGDAAACRAKLAKLRHDFRLDLPVVDLTGLPAPEARAALEALAPAPRETILR